MRFSADVPQRQRALFLDLIGADPSAAERAALALAEDDVTALLPLLRAHIERGHDDGLRGVSFVLDSLPPHQGLPLYFLARPFLYRAIESFRVYIEQCPSEALALAAARRDDPVPAHRATALWIVGTLADDATCLAAVLAASDDRSPVVQEMVAWSFHRVLQVPAALELIASRCAAADPIVRGVLYWVVRDIRDRDPRIEALCAAHEARTP